MDLITLNRINRLHPDVRSEIKNAVDYINSSLLGQNVRLRLTDTLRTFKEQDELYAIGRSKIYNELGKRLKKVTNARGGQSLHNYGLAFDIVILLDTNGDGNFEIASWDTKSDNDNDGSADWIEVVKHFKSLGWSWGGDWRSFPDYPHFEKPFGHTWQSLQQKYLKGSTFTEVIDGKTYKWVKL